MQTVSQNRKARHDYAIGEVFEAGLVLKGTEVKSLRTGSANIQDGYVAIHDGEVFMYNVHIPPFAQGNRNNHEPLRTRKLLLKAAEIDKLQSRVTERGLTLVPLKLYFNDKGKIKVEIAVAKGRKKYDKRDEIDRESSRKELREAKARHRK